MCRFAFYLGPEVTIASLVTEPTNSIVHQSLHSHERGEPLNGDGFGIGWYPGDEQRPVLFKDLMPAWSNRNLQGLARVTRTRCLAAHVRAASPGLPVQQSNCHPFAWRDLCFMHNGQLAGFRTLRRALLAELSDEAFDTIEGSTDSEHIFGMFIDRYLQACNQDDGHDALAQAMALTVSDCEALRRRHGIDAPSTLNLAVTDGHAAVVTRFASDKSVRANSLYVHSGKRYVCEDGVCRMLAPDSADGHATIIASEPLSSDDGWDVVPEGQMVVVTAARHASLRDIR